MTRQITIIGGGIAGLTTAIALNKTGIKTIVFEAASDIKAIGAGLGLGANAMIAFDRLGIKDEVMQSGRVLPFFSVYDQQGKLITRTESARLSARYGVDNFTIHRAELHQLLLSKLDAQTVHTNKKVIDIEQKENSILVKFQDGSSHETEYLIAADGIHSPIRTKLLPDVEPRYSGYTCWRAVIDNTNLNLSESSETWGTPGRFGIIPMANRKIYWYACINAKHHDTRFNTYTSNDLLNHFKDFHAPIPAILKETKDEHLLWNDIIDVKPINQYAFNNIVLIGDAAHATTPNMGQGACQAIEDAVVLANELTKNTDITQAFKHFEVRRIKKAHFITNRSWTIGKVAQLENEFLAQLRNFTFRMIPSAVKEKQFKMLYDVDF
jgi:2-polyprenyl-6-methoxyphenol hydroxylase-like FAD-dependent oxidoreductase